MTVRLDKHFAIGRQSRVWPQGWTAVAFGPFHVAHGGSIRRYVITGEDGAVRGYLLGWLVGPDGLLASGTHIQAPGEDVGFARWSASLCGRFVCLLREADRVRLYPDPCGLLGVVYAPASGTVASIPELLTGTTPDTALQRAIGVPQRFGWYPFGLTPHIGARRLMPNFALDLAAFEARRFFPTAEHPLVPNDDAASTLGRIGRAVSEAVASMCGDPRAVVHLTAGRDSRMVLGAALATGARPTVVTVTIPTAGAKVDAIVAGRLAARAGLRHELRPFVPATAADLDEWYERTGRCVSDHVAGLATTLKSWDRDELQVTGTGGEIARAFYWTEADRTAPRPDARTVVARLGLPATPQTLDAAEAWLATLPPVATATLWDLAYIEQRLGCWAGPATYGSTMALPSLSPFNSRAVVEAILSLPEQTRLGNILARHLIVGAGQRLARIPFNRLPGLDSLRFPRLAAKSLIPTSIKSFLKNTSALLGAR